MTTPENPIPTTARKKLPPVILAMVVLAALVGLFYLEEDVRGKWAWEQFKRAEEAKGEKFALTAVAPPPVPDNQNFAMAPILRVAFDYVHTTNGQKWRDTNAWEHLMSINPGQVTSVLGDPEQGALADLDAVAKFYRGNTNYPQSADSGNAADVVLAALNKFAPDLQQLRDAAAARPLSRFPIEYSYEPPAEILLPHLACVKGITLVCQLRAIAELENHQTSEAFADLQLAFRMSDSIRDEPILIDHLVRLATVTIGVQGIREGIARHAWTQPQLQEFEKYLAKLDLLHEYEQAMRGERALNIGTMDYLRRHNGNMMGSIPASDSPQSHHDAFYLAPGGWYYQNMRLLGEMYRDYILPIIDETNRVVSPDLSGQMHRNLDERHLGPYNLYVKLVLPPLAAASIRTARAQTWVDEARVACAIERYRLAHKDLPDTLTALTPQYIRKIPADLFDGQPLRYKFDTNGTYLLYSIGWNQIDDGGVPGLRTGSTPHANAAKGDWVWKFPAK